MAIISNLIPNPSFEFASLSGWVSGFGALARQSAFPLDGRVGQFYAQVTGDGSQTQVILDSSVSTRFPVTPGRWIGARIWYAHDSAASGVMLRFVWYDASGAGAGSVSTSYMPGRINAGAFHRFAAAVPAGVASVRLQIFAWSGDNAVRLPAGTRLWVDQTMLVEGDSRDEVERATDSYRDGDSPGWAWLGEPHNSVSIGPDFYAPEAELSRAGTRIEWIDLVPGFEEAVDSGTVVQVTADPARAPYVTVRPGRDSRGTLIMHFTRETGKGRPGDRAEAVHRSLATGAPHTLQLLDGHAGLGAPLQLVPVGAIRRDRQPRSDGAWTVEFDFHRTVVPA